MTSQNHNQAVEYFTLNYPSNSACSKIYGSAVNLFFKVSFPLSFSETKTKYFTRDIDCKWTNGYHFDTALMLSIFLGMFGVDRFYLGHPAIGLLKFSTLGFFFLGHLLDIILIASQIVGPADGSNYVIDYFGAGLEIIQSNDETARRRQQDWF